jgi:hypothetical protein
MISFDPCIDLLKKQEQEAQVHLIGEETGFC